MVSKRTLFLTSVVSMLLVPGVQAGIRRVRSSKLESPEGDGPLQLERRELQGATTAADTCVITPSKYSETPLFAKNSPIVPCASHNDCAGFVAKGIFPPFRPCCLANECVCGSTQMEFIPGINRCARFACTSDAQCGPGRCINQRCNFANVEPACRNDAACGGGNNVCFNGVCHIRDPNTGFITLPKIHGHKMNSGGSSSSQQTSVSTPVRPPTTGATGSSSSSSTGGSTAAMSSSSGKDKQKSMSSSSSSSSGGKTKKDKKKM